MNLAAFARKERNWMLLSLAAAVALAVVLAPKDEYFLPNFSFCLASELAVAAAALLARARAAVVSGVTLVASVLLLAFWLEMNLSPRGHNGLDWLLYLSMSIGAAVGAGLGALWLKGRNALSAPMAALFAAGSVLAGIAINLLVVCNGTFYCKL
jgi:hypothetical protein